MDPFQNLAKVTNSQGEVVQTTGLLAKKAQDPFAVLKENYAEKKASYRTVKVLHVRK